jgi:hypothetical protein
MSTAYDTAVAWELLIERYVAGLPDQRGEPWQCLETVLLLAQHMGLRRVQTDDDLIELIADEMRWQALPEDVVAETVPDIAGDPAPSLIENIIADNPADMYEAVRDHFRRCRVRAPDDKTIAKMLERYARKHCVKEPERQSKELEPLPLFAWCER